MRSKIRNAVAVNGPWLAKISQGIPSRTLHGLGQDLSGVSNIVSSGLSFFQQLNAGGTPNDTNTLIAAQNRAANDLALISQQYNMLKSGGQLSTGVIAEFQQSMQQVLVNFSNYAGSLTNDQTRAQQGIRTIQSVVQANVQSMNNDSMQLFGAPPQLPSGFNPGSITVQTGVTGTGTGGVITIPTGGIGNLLSSPYVPYIAGGLVIWMILGRK